MLADVQAAFTSALIDKDQPPPSSLRSNGREGAARRFAIHRNNALFGSIAALRSRFPVAARVVGDDFFNEMARRFVVVSPPTSPVLLGYGDSLAAFAERLPEARSLPYLPDVLRLEASWSAAFHAADAAPVTPDALAAIGTAVLGEVRVVFHPSARLLRSAYPVLAIWAMNQEAAVPQPLDDWSGDDVLIVRPALEVALRRLPPGGFEFLDTLRLGECLGTAVAEAVKVAPAFDIAAALAGLVSTGLAIRFEP